MHVRIRPLKLGSRRRDILSCRRYLAIHDAHGQLRLECHRLVKRWLRSAFCYRSERGLKTDINFECLDADGKPIEGLHALGNCMGDITAVDYPINVAGNSHGRCITYGYLLGKDLAK